MRLRRAAVETYTEPGPMVLYSVEFKDEHVEEVMAKSGVEAALKASAVYNKGKDPKVKVLRARRAA